MIGIIYYLAANSIRPLQNPPCGKLAQLVGQSGMSGVISGLLTRWVTAQEKALASRQASTAMELWVGGPANTRDHRPEQYWVTFTGRLVGDSEGYSVTQIPRVMVYQTENGRLIVYKTWRETQNPEHGATYEVFSDHEAFSRDPQALDTMWVTGNADEDTHADFTTALQRDIAQALATDLVVRID